MKYAFKPGDKGIINFKASVKDKRVVIEICDNGSGLPESFSLHESTGFGLQVVDMLTEQLGGTIKAESGKGSRFIIELPHE